MKAKRNKRSAPRLKPVSADVRIIADEPSTSPAGKAALGVPAGKDSRGKRPRAVTPKGRARKGSPMPAGEAAVPPRAGEAPATAAAPEPEHGAARSAAAPVAGSATAQDKSPSALPDFERLAHNMGLFVEESGKAAAAFLKPRGAGHSASGLRDEVRDVFSAFGQVAAHWLTDPSRVLRAQAAFSSQFVDLWAETLRRLTDGDGKTRPEPEKPVDKRFAAPEWRDIPAFDFLRQTYLLTTDWANTLVDDAKTVDAGTRERAKFYLRQVSSAMSPSNFLATNPELLRETLAEGGENLVRGMRMLAEDIDAGKGELRIRQTDPGPFKLGVNMATTPGKVVFRNDLMELIQYAPATPDVFRRPLLIVPPWINKFYVLDLNREKSFVRWAVEQGLTVFVVSWVNPDERHTDKGFEAYMREGIFAALDAIEAAVGVTRVSAIGYCVGGTLLATTLAYMAARGDARVESATFFAAQTDFREAGDLKVFAGEEQIAALEAQMKETGYLRGEKMANAFNMLRPNDLIWSYVVDNYLKGKAPKPFDLLTWNADSTRMPAANHVFYLRNFYLGNKLTKGELEIAGVRLDLGRVTVPVYNLATREDHIAPARSVFSGAKFFGGPMRYVLAGSGHIAGVVNPPAKGKYQYWDGLPVAGLFEDWLRAAEEHPGSWWPDWLAWLIAQAPDKVPARVPGEGKLPALCDAPGEYVRVKS